MTSDSRTPVLIPLPELPPHLGQDFSADRVGLRRFGIAESDLAIDFGAQNRAALVTQVLEQCTVAPEGRLPEGFYRELSAGKRLEYLLVLAAGGPERSLSLVYKCGGCGEELELELTLEELTELQREADMIETVGVELGGQRIEFRKPLGRDQEAWAGMVFRNEREAAAWMLYLLAVDPGMLSAIEHESLGAIEDALDEADPLIDFSCSVSCDECGEPNDYGVDLMETAIEMLSRAQRQLISAVHRLASHYHWSEKDIFAVPDWRRRQYLELIAALRK